MQNFSGVGVTPGRIAGPVKQMTKPVSEPPAGERLPPSMSAEEAVRHVRAASKAVQLDLAARAGSTKGGTQAVLEATAQMAADPMLLDDAEQRINDGASPARAVWDAGASAAEMLRSLGGYMAERATDVLDVRARIVAELRGVPAPGIPASDEPFILVAEDLAPADTATLDPEKVLALITSGGGPQSHTAIIARNLGLPAIVAAAGVEALADGTLVYLDAAAGTITANPSPEQLTAAQSWASTSSKLSAFDGHGHTADGHSVPLMANVGTRGDALKASEAGAQGVGLLRTEFCFLGRDSEPSVDEQIAAYREVFDAFGGSKVVIRTLDAGADKPLPFLSGRAEPNPALGVRGFRTDLVAPGVLERQLKAIAAAAADSDAEVWVMAPMISTAGEAAGFAALCDLEGLRTCGVMVEVPSAALTAKEILGRVEFASLGTNDLTQYVMAADRQSGPLATLNDPWQPALLQLVSLTVAGAAAEGQNKPVGVCGEAAADPALAVVLVGLGVASLSMAPRSLAAVAAVLGSVSLQEAQELADFALTAPSAAEARERVRSKLSVLDELGL